MAAIRLRSQLGNRSSATCELLTLTKDGKCIIPGMNEEQAHSDLGIMVHFDHQRSPAATFAKNLVTMQERSLLHLKPDLPSQGRLYSLWTCVFSGTKWLANMGHYIPV